MSLCNITSQDRKLRKMLDAIDNTERSPNADLQWDAYSEFGWRLAVDCLQKMTPEKKQMLAEHLMNKRVEHKDVLRYIANDPDIAHDLDAMFDLFLKSATRKPSKNETKAGEAMETAKYLMINSRYSEAITKFSEALENFAMSSAKFGECLRHRALCLYKSKQYEDAHKDVCEALAIIKSEKNKVNEIHLSFLKSQLLRHLGKHQEANQWWEAAQRKLRNANDVDDKLKRQILNDFTVLRNSKITEIEYEEVNIPIFNNENLPGAPKFVDMTINPAKGRTTTASIDIPRGSIVMSEAPVVTWLSPSNYDNYCNFCFKKMPNRYIPCRSCTFVRYCSLECEDKAWKKYHSVECSALHLLKYCSFNHMSLRVIVLFGFENVMKAIEEYNHSTKKPSSSLPLNYTSFYSFTGDRFYLNSDQILAFSLGTLFVTKIAERMNLIRRDSPHYFTFAGIMLRHVFQTNINCFAVVDINMKRHRPSQIYVDIGDMSKIGITIYFGTSMSSHSCDYNCYKYTYGSQMVFIANRDIKAGEEITITYCPHYKKMSFTDRQDYLRHHYQFECRCTACVHHWENEHFAYRCPECSGALIWNVNMSNYCMSCGIQNADVLPYFLPPTIATENVEEAKSLLDMNQTQGVRPLLDESLKIMRKIFYSDVQEEPVLVQLCRYYELKKKYYKAYECCLKLTLIWQKKSDEHCLEAVSTLIQGVDYLMKDIEELSIHRRPISSKLAEAHHLFSICLTKLKYNQRQQLALVSKLYIDNFRLVPKIAEKLEIYGTRLRNRGTSVTLETTLHEFLRNKHSL